MGLGGIGIWQLLIILLIVVLLFGTKRLRGLGTDIGDAIKGFRKSVSDDKSPEVIGDEKKESLTDAENSVKTEQSKEQSKDQNTTEK